MITTLATDRVEAVLGEQRRFCEAAGARAPEWVRELRDRARTRFAALGFPTVRQEEWRFTNVTPVANATFRLADKAPINAVDLASRVTLPGSARLVLLNGRFAPELSVLDGLPNGVVAGSLATAIAADAPEVAHLGQMAWEQAPFIALNTAFLLDGAFIVIPADTTVETPIHIVSINGGAGKVMAHPRALIVAGDGSRAQIVQTFLGAAGEAHLTNVVTEVAAGPNATLDLYTDQRETDTAYHLAAIQVRLQAGATVRSRVVTLGGKLLRNDIAAILDGEGAHCALDGCYLVDGDRMVDTHTTIDHATPHCTSHELYKGILDGKARAVFNGRIIVREDAQKTDAKQTNRALLLSDEAQINSNPQLEIFADDVKCTHGAAIGQLDEEALFYLRARGLTFKEARDMLIHSYAGEVLNGIAVEALRCQLERELFAQLDRDLAEHDDGRP
ncbi:MAG: Fe-S cluster assembly protein SufD [Acidobacteriota bacterium]